MKDRRIVIDEILFELTGPDPGRQSRALATQAVDEFAEGLRRLQERRLADSPDAEAIHIECLRVCLGPDPVGWPSTGEVAQRLQQEVERQIDAVRE